MRFFNIQENVKDVIYKYIELIAKEVANSRNRGRTGTLKAQNK